MTAVGQVKRAVMAAIAAAGGAAVESYSVEQLKCYQTAVAAVGAKETAIDESGAIEYLGEKTDEKTQQPVSVYGRRMRLTLLLEVYAPRELGAAGCETAAETVTQALMTALPEGLKLKTIQWGKAGWDKTAGMFRLEANATLRVTVAGRFSAAPGDRAHVSGTKLGLAGEFRVIECVRRFGESGEMCEVTMQRE